MSSKNLYLDFDRPKGFRTHAIVLVTTMLDTETRPVEMIRGFYDERWGVELHSHEMEALMALNVLCWKNPDRKCS